MRRARPRSLGRRTDAPAPRVCCGARCSVCHAPPSCAHIFRTMRTFVLFFVCGPSLVRRRRLVHRRALVAVSRCFFINDVLEDFAWACSSRTFYSPLRLTVAGAGFRTIRWPSRPVIIVERQKGGRLKKRVKKKVKNAHHTHTHTTELSRKKVASRTYYKLLLR